MTSTNSKRFHCSHLIHRICLEKIGHAKASLTSQDNSGFSMEILEKMVKLYRLDQTCTTYSRYWFKKWIPAGHGIKSNPATSCHLIHHTSSMIAEVISSMPLLPYLCNPATCTAEGAGGKHAMCVIPEGLHCKQWCCIIPSEGLDVMDEMEGIQRRKAMAWWVGWMRFVWFVLRWTCDFCGFFGNWFLIHRRPESPNPACCKFWLGRRSRSWIAQKSCLNGWFKAEPLWQTISWNVFPRAKISRSAILHFFHALKIWERSVESVEVGA